MRATVSKYIVVPYKVGLPRLQNFHDLGIQFYSKYTFVCSTQDLCTVIVK
jgi:hypothetical protein